jgi:predicted aspartyl protease
VEISNKLKRDLGNPDEAPTITTASVTSSSGATLVPVKAQGGTFVVPVLISKTITLNFVIDSGAADVSIPADVVLTLVRSGTLQRSDFIGTQTYRLADGSTVPSTTFRIRSLTMNNVVVENVTGSIANVKGDLLLGQSFLSRFKSWSIDNGRQALVLSQ